MATENCNSARDLPSVVDPPPISKLGDDLLVQVLIRLPAARSACRCKPVCKLWSSLISDPYFARRFVSHHQSRNDGGTPWMPSDSILSFLPVPDEARYPFSAMDSFKDLLLCGFEDFDGQNGELGRSYLVCNPVTKQWIPLPLAPEKSMPYVDVAARLVCQPVSKSHSNSNNLDPGDGQAFLYSYEHRFRVVCFFQSDGSIKLDVFCPESGEWTKKPLVLDGFCRHSVTNVVSPNGEVFWLYNKSGADLYVPLLAAFNPFRLDIPPTSIDTSAVVFAEPDWDLLDWDISGSQDALHMVSLDKGPEETSTNFLTVWRLEEGRKSWTKQYQIELDRKSYELVEYEEHRCYASVLHSKRPEIIFLDFLSFNYRGRKSVIFSCNMKSGEMNFLSERGQYLPRWPVFQLWNPSWPTPIPWYEELRGAYDGSYTWLALGSSNSLPR